MLKLPLLRLVALTVAFTAYNSHVSAQEVGWTVVAADRHGHWGYALGKPDRSVAEEAALAGCGNEGCHREGVGRFRCLAYTESRAGGYWYGVGLGASQDAVVSTAMGGCSAGAPSGTCRVVKVICG